MTAVFAHPKIESRDVSPLAYAVLPEPTNDSCSTEGKLVVRLIASTYASTGQKMASKCATTTEASNERDVLGTGTHTHLSHYH